MKEEMQFIAEQLGTELTNSRIEVAQLKYAYEKMVEQNRLILSERNQMAQELQEVKRKIRELEGGEDE